MKVLRQLVEYLRDADALTTEHRRALCRRGLLLTPFISEIQTTTWHGSCPMCGTRFCCRRRASGLVRCTDCGWILSTEDVTSHCDIEVLDP